MSLADINPHYALLQSEGRLNEAERSFLRWAAEAERLIGNDIDLQGLSDAADAAYASWEIGMTPSEFALDWQTERSA